jgi:predicted RNA-binding Zn ribbon-like protein
MVAAPRTALCLDFTNTLMRRGGEPKETLQNFDDLRRWCAANGGCAEAAPQTPARAAPALAEAIAIREAIYQIFYAAADGKPPAPADLNALNAALRRAPARRRIVRGESGFGWSVEVRGASAAEMLAPVLWSAADLIAGPDLARVRYCANDQCRWLFIDDSKNSSRRWCSMESCGNRAKARRHYARIKAG